MSKYVTPFIKGSSEDLFAFLNQVGLIDEKPSHVRRVVIDLEHGSVAKCYIEKYLDDEKIGRVGMGDVGLVVDGRKVDE